MKKSIAILFLILSTNLYSERLYFYVNTRSVRLRENPSLESKILRILKENENVDFTGSKSEQKFDVLINNKNVSNHFFQVTTIEGLNGWIYGHYITDSKTFELNTDHCSRAIPTETVVNINKNASFDKKNLEYNEEFTISNTRFSIINGGCDYFTHVISIDTELKLENYKQKILINLIKEKISLLLKYYQNDFDLKLIINHLQNKNITFDTNYEFISGKKIKNIEDENPGPIFRIEKPNIKNGKFSVDIILGSGLL